MSGQDTQSDDVTDPAMEEATHRAPDLDSRFTDILLEGQRIPDDENFFHSVPRIDAPHSAPHSRSSSFRNRPRPKLNVDILAAQRPRTNSLPNAYLALPDPFFLPETGRVHRVRSFKTTSKGLVNHGDSFMASSSSLRSNSSVGSVSDGLSRSPRRSSHASDDSGTADPQAPSENNNLHSYRVLMMGAPGVGKTALTRQFMTSEYKGTYTESNTPDLLEPERKVSVLLDGLESSLHFIAEEQHPDFETEEIPIDAFVVVFAVSDPASYRQAVEAVRRLRDEVRTNRAVILVGNKTDLARQRRVARHEAARLARKYRCRYTETSAALNHHVDELLVGILSQIRQQLAPTAPGGLGSPTDPHQRPRSKSPARAISQFFSRIFGAGDRRSKSCELLFVQ
ncbi:hypothetical protein BsWGS_22656 [Bradybaena similaris]